MTLAGLRRRTQAQRGQRQPIQAHDDQHNPTRGIRRATGLRRATRPHDDRRRPRRPTQPNTRHSQANRPTQGNEATRRRLLEPRRPTQPNAGHSQGYEATRRRLLGLRVTDTTQHGASGASRRGLEPPAGLRRATRPHDDRRGPR